MQTSSSKPPRLAGCDLVVALFTDGVAASDAVADLQLAGFHADRIGIALSAEGKRHDQECPAAKIESPILSGTHSIPWKFRHSVEHDTRAHGYSLNSQPAAESSESHGPLYSELDLEDTLLGLGVTEDRIYLLNSEVGAKGLLMFVDAGSHPDRVQAILERNCGLIRTDMATEAPPPSVH